MRKANADLLQQLKAHQIKPKNDYVTETRTYQLITPLFGGGVEASKNDPSMLIRATSIRGHLRFWWRAIYASKYPNLDLLREAESALWGTASNDKNGGQSSVVIIVTLLRQGNPKGHVVIKGKKVSVTEWQSPYAYVAFPLQDKKIEDALRENVSFEVTFLYPRESQVQVNATLWAWETFGGIGARTRRGFGAIQRIKPTIEQSNSLKSYIQDGLQRYLGEHTADPNLPVLPKANSPYIFVARTEWETLIEDYKWFRQWRTANNPTLPEEKIQRRSPGRSKWPEPEAIRWYTKRTRTKDKGRRPKQPNPFPRSAFGLPIITKFKDDDSGDPKKTKLEGLNHDRMASPLLIRPYVWNRQLYCVVIVLQSARVPPGGLVLRNESGEYMKTNPELTPNQRVSHQLSKVQAQTIEPLQYEKEFPENVLLAFIRYLESAEYE